MSKNKELYEISQTIINSNAYKISNQLETLKRNFFIFNRNHTELNKVLNLTKNEKKMLKLWDLKNRNQLGLVLNELARLLHNYLASAKTLISYTRVLIKHWYKNTEFLNEYNEEVKNRFDNNPLAKCIEKLRDYCLHYSLPITNANFKFTPIEGTHNVKSIDFSFSLVKESLLFWDGWKTKARDFLNNSDEDINIESFVNNYYEKVKEFHQWIVKRIIENNKGELEWLAETQRQMIDLMDDEEKKIRGLN